MGNETKEREDESRGIPGIRYVFTALGFMGFWVIFTLRVNLNVAIVAMVNGSAVYHQNNRSEECLEDLASNATRNNETHTTEGEFDWSPKVQGIVLGSFYYGYFITQIPGGRLAEMYSGRIVFGFAALVCAILNLLTPLAARHSFEALVAVRVIEGLAQGVTMPAMHSMLGKWLPETEKGLLTTILYNGTTTGTLTANLITGILCGSNLFGGWPSAFYVFGLIGCVWFLLWMTLVSDTPASHPWITQKELKYIQQNQNLVHHVQRLTTIPWSSIMTSVPFIALMITQFGQDWCYFTILNDLPTYMSTILHFEIETTGMASSLPYFCQMAVGCTVGCVTDFFVRRKYFSTNFIRKFCNSLACVGTVAGLTGVIYAGCDRKLVVAMFTISNAMGGFCYCGYLLSHLDLSPEYAGTLMGITNTISNLTGFIAPAVVGSLTEKHQTLHQWHIVFYITIGILSSTGLVYALFITTKKQNWAEKATQNQKLLSGNGKGQPHYGSPEEHQTGSIQ